nr:PREDICTED: leucine-rich repeat neuronal protein 1 [Bemisia tabaci]
MCFVVGQAPSCILLLLCCFIASIFALNNSEPCLSNCQCLPNILECKDVDFSKINIPQDVRVLKLMRILILELTNKSLGSTTKLKEVVLNENGITHIDFNFFENHHQVEILNVAGNQIKALDSELFRPLTFLKTVVFKSNHIKKLHENLFYKVEALEMIDFSDNRIVTPITRCMLRDLKELRYLDLSRNEIPSIDSDALEKNELLQYVNISHNKLEDVKTLFEDLTMLTELDLSSNQIKILDKDVFEDCSSLRRLLLNNNRIEYLPLLVFQYLENLTELKLSNNPLKHLPTDIFHQNKRIQYLNIDNINIVHLQYELFHDLKEMKSIDISNNTILQSIDDGIFINKPELHTVNLASTNISRIPVSILSLDNLKNLKLENLRIKCDCRSTWLIKFWEKFSKVNLQYTNFQCKEALQINVVEFLSTLRCDEPQIIYNSPLTYYMLLSGAMLDCLAVGHPEPTITWFTPNGITFHDPLFNETNHPKVHDNQRIAIETDTMNVMANGSLHIKKVLREDVGNYTCFVLNKNGNISAVTTIRLDPDTFNKRQFMSFAVGIFCAVIFLTGTVVVHAIIFVCKKICGKSKEESQKTDIHQMIEAAEQYRSQQLEKLRENYMAQIKKIEEDCAQQTKWIWESYHGQVKDSKDTKDYGAGHIPSIKEQYNDQVRKVRDYTTSQLSKVRENYVFQRDKIRKFSAHQVLRFRENCKYQQQALNKVLENFNIDNCKNGCGQSTSEINFSSDRDVGEIVASSKCHTLEGSHPIDELLSSCNEGDAKLGETKCPILKCRESGSCFSIYYTPTNTTNSPLTPRVLNRRDDTQPCHSDDDKLLPLLAQADDNLPIQLELKSRHNSIVSIHYLGTSSVDENKLAPEQNQRLLETDSMKGQSNTVPTLASKSVDINPSECSSA